MNDLAQRTKNWSWENRELERRVARLEKWAHEPFDFSHLIRRLEKLEKTLVAKELK